MKNIFTIGLIGLAMGATSSAFASNETRTAQNSIYVEGLGAGLAYSVNYERLLTNDLGVRLGFSYLSLSASVGDSSADATFITVPLTASYLGISSGSHALELGGGMTIGYASGSASHFGVESTGAGMVPIGTAMVGYRFQPRNGGFQFRVGAQAFIGDGLGDLGGFGFAPWAYLSLGATF